MAKSIKRKMSENILSYFVAGGTVAGGRGVERRVLLMGIGTALPTFSVHRDPGRAVQMQIGPEGSGAGPEILCF